MRKISFLIISLAVAAAAPAPAQAAVASPAITPPPDAGDTYAGIGGGGFSCNEHAICTATFHGSASMTGWARAVLHVSLTLYDDGSRVGSNTNFCRASTSCSTTQLATVTFVRGHVSQVCAAASGQASYNTGTAVGSDQACMYIGGAAGGGGAISQP